MADGTSGDLIARRIGSVESVTATSIMVAVDFDAPHGVSLGSGTPVRFPLVNGLVVIPSDEGMIVGLVFSVGMIAADPSRVSISRDSGLVQLPNASRRLGVTALGILRLIGYREDGQPTYAIDRGVPTPPTIGAAVLLPTVEEIAAVVEGSTEGGRVTIGRSTLSRDLKVRVDPDRIFGRHLAVLGNTGSGKSCSVAGLIRWSLQAAAEQAKDKVHARFIVIDPNGEYKNSFSDVASVKVFKADPAEGGQQLRVPAWLWNSAEWSAFSDASKGVQQPLLNQALRLLRAGGEIRAVSDRRFATVTIGYLSIMNGIIGSGPAAYSTFPGVKNVGTLLQSMAETMAQYLGTQSPGVETLVSELVERLHEIVSSNIDRGYFQAFAEPDLIGVVERLEALREALPAVDVEGEISEDSPVFFDVSEVGSHLEVLAGATGVSAAQFAATVSLRIRTMLGHLRIRAVVGKSDSVESLEEWLATYLGSDDDCPQVTVIDLSLVPSSLMHLIAAVIARVVLEALQRYRRSNQVELPTVLVVEEAHHFVNRSAERVNAASEVAVVCRETFETIAREGRKFGLGLVLSSQRPSEISPTALSQCNTFLLHRIVNDRDQELVRRLVPDNLGRMMDDLPTLPTRHAVLLGWATAIPMLIEVRELEGQYRPQSGDPHFWDVWTGVSRRTVDWDEVADDWRSGLY